MHNFVEYFYKAKQNKYIKRIPKKSGKGYIYFYSWKEYKDYLLKDNPETNKKIFYKQVDLIDNSLRHVPLQARQQYLLNGMQGFRDMVNENVKNNIAREQLLNNINLNVFLRLKRDNEQKLKIQIQKQLAKEENKRREEINKIVKPLKHELYRISSLADNSLQFAIEIPNKVTQENYDFIVNTGSYIKNMDTNIQELTKQLSVLNVKPEYNLHNITDSIRKKIEVMQGILIEYKNFNHSDKKNKLLPEANQLFLQAKVNTEKILQAKKDIETKINNFKANNDTNGYIEFILNKPVDNISQILIDNLQNIFTANETWLNDAYNALDYSLNNNGIMAKWYKEGADKDEFYENLKTAIKAHRRHTQTSYEDYFGTFQSRQDYEDIKYLANEGLL